jgi:hypothetical protein
MALHLARVLVKLISLLLTPGGLVDMTIAVICLTHGMLMPR